MGSTIIVTEDRRERRGWHGRREGEEGLADKYVSASIPTAVRHTNQGADSCPHVTTWIEAFLYQLLPRSPHWPVSTEGTAPD